MASQADQFDAELVGSGSLVDREYARLLDKTSQPAGLYSLRDLYQLATEEPRIPLGRYISVGPPPIAASSAGLRAEILALSPQHYWPLDMWNNAYPDPIDLGSSPIAITTNVGYITNTPILPDAEVSAWPQPGAPYTQSDTTHAGTAYDAVTFLGVIKPNGTFADTAIFAHEAGSAVPFRWAYNPSGNISVYGGPGGVPSILAANITPNVPNFVAHVMNDAGRSKAYVNGVQVGDAALGTNPWSTVSNRWYIGTFGGSPFPGDLSHLAVIPSALSAEQIAHLNKYVFGE